jgi:hypothetical protein
MDVQTLDEIDALLGAVLAFSTEQVTGVPSPMANAIADATELHDAALRINDLLQNLAPVTDP